MDLMTNTNSNSDAFLIYHYKDDKPGHVVGVYVGEYESTLAKVITHVNSLPLDEDTEYYVVEATAVNQPKTKFNVMVVYVRE